MLHADSDELRLVSNFFRALADETRLRIVALLSHGELCVCHIQQALNRSQPTVSRQLGVLRAAGIVADRRDGTWVHYRLLEQVQTDRARHLRSLVSSFARQEQLRREVHRLRKRCGPEACR